MDEMDKPRKRRDFEKKSKKDRKIGPKNPRYDRNEKHKSDPLDQVLDDFYEDMEELIDMDRDIFGP